MGQGKSKSKDYSMHWTIRRRELVRSSKLIRVEIDDVVQSRAFYGFLKELGEFNMSEPEFLKFVEENPLHITFGWDLDEYSEGRVVFDPKSKVFHVNDENTRFFMYKAIKALNLIESKYQEKRPEEKLFSRITFDYLEDDAAGSTEYDWATVRALRSRGLYKDIGTSSIEVTADPHSIPIKKQGKVDLDWIAVRNEEANVGWHPVTGFSEATAIHEAGHAIYNNIRMTKGSVGDYLKEAVEEWYIKTWKDPVSGYATRNSHEAFAECFSLYAYGGKSDSKMYEGFKKIMHDFDLEDMKGIF